MLARGASRCHFKAKSVERCSVFMLCYLSLQVGSSFGLLPYCVCLSMLLCAKCGSQVETGVVLHEEVIRVWLNWALAYRVQVVRVILCWPCQHRVAMSGG